MSETYDRGTADATQARRFPALKRSTNVTLLRSRTEPDRRMRAGLSGPRTATAPLPGLIDGVPAYTPHNSAWPTYAASYL
jgi:hypothetical protein